MTVFIYKIFLKSDPEQCYVGSTSNINQRISEHRKCINSIRETPKSQFKLYKYIKENG
mgnify:CR=1 FL=1